MTDSRAETKNNKHTHNNGMKLSEKKSGGEFTPHPETDGMVKATIVDVTPLKTVQSQFGEREVFRIVFESEVEDENGRRFCVWSRGYTPSLNEKANFRRDLKKLLGRDLTPLELREFDTDSLINLPVKLLVQHQQGENGQTYTAIMAMAPDKSEEPLTASGNYVRVRDREAKDSAAGSQAGYSKAPAAKAEEQRAKWQKTKVHVGQFSGLELGDLEQEAVMGLINKWLPKYRNDPKPKADDKRLAEALEEVASLLGLDTAPAEDY